MAEQCCATPHRDLYPVRHLHHTEIKVCPCYFIILCFYNEKVLNMNAASPDVYMNQLPAERRDPMDKLRNVILGNLPPGFSETINYGMIGYVVPHSVYSKGYHADPKQPLPFINIASQKNHIALYHMGLYNDKNLLDWFLKEYSKYSKTKPDMGKSCLRFKKPFLIPYPLIGELATKVSVEEWINRYESHIRKK